MSQPNQLIVPNIWSNGVAQEQADFYLNTFRDARQGATQHYPTEGLPDFQQHLAGQPVVVDVEVAGFTFTLINAGPEFTPNPSLNLMVNFDPLLYSDAEEYLEQVYAALSDGGQVLMPLQEYPFAKKYAFVEDRYHVSWQLILTNPAGDPRPFLMPSLLFGGAAQNRCREAVQTYIDLLPDSRWGLVAEYPEPTGPADAGSIMFSDFQLGGQWFTAMDSGAEQPFTFSEGASLLVLADGQSEIDRLWEVLSTVPEAEQCGWCRDAFGLSWQVVPTNLGELMARPGAYENMMQMKKLEIDRF